MDPLTVAFSTLVKKDAFLYQNVACQKLGGTITEGGASRNAVNTVTGDLLDIAGTAQVIPLPGAKVAY